MRDRRNFLKVSAGSLASLSAIGAASARRRAGGPSTETVGEAFHRGVVEDGADGARDNLRDLGLETNVEASQAFQVNENPQVSTVRGHSGSGSDVEGQMVYSDPKNSDSELVVGASPDPDKDDEVWMAAGMSLRDDKATVRNSWWCDDAIGIGYVDSDWAPVGTPSVGATEDHTARFTTEDVADNALAGTVNIVNHTGPQATWDSLPDAGASLTGKFHLRDGGEPSTLWGSYTHTFAGSPTSAITGISGGRGGISVDVSFGAAKAWSIAHPSDPRDDL